MDTQIVGNIGNGQTRAREAGDGEIAVMGKEGDIKTIWNPKNPDEVANAKKTFDDMKKKGYAAFRVNKEGEAGEQITTFDESLGKMILMVPPLQGG